MTDLAAIATRLDDAARHAKAVPQLSEPISLDEAYQVQALSLARRHARGEVPVGVKMGFTSFAKMEQMGIDEVIWGRLTDAMHVSDGGTVDMARFVHPRIEPEVAFLLGADLPAEVSEEEAFAAIEAMAPALEIIDSRYENFRFSLSDVVADNSSSSAFVTGAWREPVADLAGRKFSLSFGDDVRQSDTGAAILGDPVRSLVRAARLAAGAGEPLRKGAIVLAGGATAAETVEPDVPISVSIEGMGTASVSFAGVVHPT